MAQVSARSIFLQKTDDEVSSRRALEIKAKAACFCYTHTPLVGGRKVWLPAVGCCVVFPVFYKALQHVYLFYSAVQPRGRWTE